MIIFDYKKRDFKEIKINNKKKYFIKSGKKFIEVPIEVYRLYKADYMKTYSDYSHVKALVVADICTTSIA